MSMRTNLFYRALPQPAATWQHQNSNTLIDYWWSSRCLISVVVTTCHMAVNFCTLDHSAFSTPQNPFVERNLAMKRPSFSLTKSVFPQEWGLAGVGSDMLGVPNADTFSDLQIGTHSRTQAVVARSGTGLPKCQQARQTSNGSLA